MIEINNKKLCESCFSETEKEGVCPCCGFNSAEYSPDPMALPIGTKLDDKIIIGRVMGKGGFGITYLGYDVRMGKTVAVKEYYPNGISYRTPGSTEISIADTKSAETFESGAEKFYTEAEMVSQFNGNPNIVSVYDYFRANSTVYLVMEYINGVTLKNYVSRRGVLTDGQALFVMEKIAAALSITHSAGVLHRDISPDNIMICADGKVKLIDFGAARQILAESSSNLTVVMKPGYTPIEQYTKKGRQGAWTDIYSLGVSMYYALTRVIIDDPYARMDDDEELDKNKHSINEQLWEIIKKCTMINAADRCGSAIELRKALKSVSAPPAPEAIALSAEDLKCEPEEPDDQDNRDEALQATAAPRESEDDFPVTVASEASPASEEREPDPPISGGEFPKTVASEEELSEKPRKIEGSASYAPQKKKSKKFPKKGKLIAIICAAAALAVIAAVCIVVGVNRANSGGGTVISMSSDDILDIESLLEFDGDVKVTLKLGHASKGAWIKVIDSSRRPADIEAVDGKAIDDPNMGSWYYDVSGKREFTFIMTRTNINKVSEGLKFETEKVRIKSAEIQAYSADN